jgi:hypothetical protein
MVFLFHVFVGFIIGLLLTISWTVIGIFEMYEIIPSIFGDVGEPTASSILILLSSTALSLGILGVIVWFLLTLLYNIIAGFVRGIRFEVETTEVREKGDQADDE